MSDPDLTPEALKQRYPQDVVAKSETFVTRGVSKEAALGFLGLHLLEVHVYLSGLMLRFLACCRCHAFLYASGVPAQKTSILLIQRQ